MLFEINGNSLLGLLKETWDFINRVYWVLIKGRFLSKFSSVLSLFSVGKVKLTLSRKVRSLNVICSYARFYNFRQFRFKNLVKEHTFLFLCICISLFTVDWKKYYIMTNKLDKHLTLRRNEKIIYSYQVIYISLGVF